MWHCGFVHQNYSYDWSEVTQTAVSVLNGNQLVNAKSKSSVTFHIREYIGGNTADKQACAEIFYLEECQ